MHVSKQLLKKRMSKGPYKILLTPSDFVFPQVTDSLRVDEGIEAMLCCWLQQLREFGGPEVAERPDLLKGSFGSLQHLARPATLAGSTGSLAQARSYLQADTRARYNGDLVQLKELPVQGTFELKSKAMDVLMTLHGLRHENVNPLLGCLVDSSRPALVFEWCSRGSLEDVLVQDEIKLDWSFRLSLLTDLVRGMRYLHTTPVRVHGYLTSRNCVIDARWVLKVTDYGLPAFYEAQNIPPPCKSARDLLWTAPELLRNPALRKQGSQPGDVYSFGIVMQEVVVRGEPFCMLALSPEEILEKVKRPPPLIRPSVSKGAAPPEAINIMRQCWAEQPDMRPDFGAVHDLFKKLNHGRKVNFVDTMFQMLEKYSNNLEELIRERTEQLDMEKKKTEQLLNRMLPSSVADKLKLGMPVDPEDFREVTIYFSDIVGFTTISAYSTPFQVVDLLNDLYTCFDATINAYNVYKVETIGDAYMVVGGLPVRITDHADQVATMALDLLHQSGRFRIRHLPGTPLRLRIGLHTGPCCAGVVGLTMPRYCLFGDTVNTASRMESTGSAWRIHLSQATKEQLDKVGGYQLEYRGETDIKGKGKMHTYWLLSKAGFNKELPVPPPIG
ncbi:retinal guanylyl cyclase 2 [Schistocerca cancellata]|uniref:retinal guanylyl cyclase 2 n=1 Tax=Schistocerca cancellata TaxID=274614 RepID=UPI0021181F7C|nr:retinal guanylyl cyclase 2 [Schistocerca cancellata]